MSTNGQGVAKWGVGALGALLVVMLVIIPLMVVLLVTLLLEDAPEQDTCRTSASASVTASIPDRWKSHVEDAAAVSGVPAGILAAQLDKESGWNERAVNSGSGAAGMAQFMPATWAAYGSGDPMNGADAIKAMGRYMGKLMDLAAAAGLKGEDQVKGALAAYNWGDGNMARAGWDWKKGPAETTNYVSVITDVAQVKFSIDCVPLAWDGDLGDGEWTTPLPNGKMTSAGGYGPRNIPGYPAWANNHAGIDLATMDGKGVVIAPTDLRITGEYPVDGCVLAKATTTPHFGLEFCHLDRNQVKVGDKLKRGQPIGEEGGVAGNLGGRTVEHLHFAMYDPSGPDPQYPGHQNPVIDPTPILRAKGAL